MRLIRNDGPWFTVRWGGDHVAVMDQRVLPEAEQYVALETVADVFAAVKDLMVRGAPAIGIIAAWGVVLACREFEGGESSALLDDLRSKASYLQSARPTAVNLSWAIHRMLARMEELAEAENGSFDSIFQGLVAEAQSIQAADERSDRAIGENLLSLLDGVEGIITHCNAGQLAASRYGTALAPIYLGVERGRRFHIYVDETRPVLQGARLTAWELGKLGVAHTLICDNMSSVVMSKKKVDAVIVGADRIAANGDVANKIGTLGLAIIAKHFEVPFFVAAPFSTVDLTVSDGNQIPIEERGADEVLKGLGRLIAPPDCDVYNPAFDVTPNGLVSAIVTEQGVAFPPYESALAKQLVGLS